MLAAQLLLGLLIAVAVLVTISRRVHVPYPIVLLVGGFALGLVPGLPQIEIEGDVVLIVFVPPIVYVAAFFTSIRSLRTEFPTVASLAVGLVLASAAAVAVVAHALVPGLGWPLAIALGAIVAPPDEVAAASVFERLPVPRRLTSILAGEALLNDATALTLYRLALGAAVVGAVSAAGSFVALVIVALGGAVIGLTIGWVVMQIRSRVEDTPVEITISLLTPYASYLSAELIGASGVIACVATGLFLGRKTSRFMGSDVRLAGRAVWEMLVFLLNGAIFILIGLQLLARGPHGPGRDPRARFGRPRGERGAHRRPCGLAHGDGLLAPSPPQDGVSVRGGGDARPRLVRDARCHLARPRARAARVSPQR